MVDVARRLGEEEEGVGDGEGEEADDGQQAGAEQNCGAADDVREAEHGFTGKRCDEWRPAVGKSEAVRRAEEVVHLQARVHCEGVVGHRGGEDEAEGGEAGRADGLEEVGGERL